MGITRAKFFLVSFLLGSFAYAAPPSLFHKGDHCVAYKVNKRLMLIRNVEVVGRNCDVTTRIVPEIGGLYAYRVEIPIASFDSKESERDRDVKKLLKESIQSSLVFTTESYTKDKWKELLVPNNSFSVKGTLSIGGKEFPVTAEVNIQEQKGQLEVDGIISTKFKNFDLDPPVLMGGLMAKVSKELDLHFHLLSEKTLGMMSIIESDK